MNRLRRADCSQPGITRRRRGRGFEYLDAAGRRVEDLETLDRMRALAIPPAWAEVWICADPNGHLQAVGTDAAGRRQYRYHERWRQRREQETFDEMISFARSLPRLRKIAVADLAERGRRRELACAVRLLDRGFFRVGGEEYADENRSYGLATLEKSHVELAGGRALVFDYPAKSGKRRLQAVVDPEVYEVVASLKRRRGKRLFSVRSSEINAYIKEATGGDFSAKDFRTWHGTVLAAVALAVSEGAATPTGRRRAVSRAVDEVAHYLGNTPAVYRASYIDPRVFDRYRAGITISPALGGLAQLDEERVPATQGRSSAPYSGCSKTNRDLGRVAGPEQAQRGTDVSTSFRRIDRNMMWWGSPADFKGVAPFCLTFGGIAQFLAGMWAYKARDIVATLAHGMWGAFWIAFFVLQLLQANGTVPTAAPHQPDLVFGMWMVGLAYVTWTCALGAMLENGAVFLVLATLAAGASLSAAGFITGGFESGWTTAGGWAFVISAALAWYTVTAMVLHGIAGKWILPSFPRAASPRTQPIELPWAEPGIKHGQ